MTSPIPTRRPSRRLPGRGTAISTRNVRSEVGEKLRDAREIRGVDLHRVERDTKIRYKFLAALEDGEFTELPGDVYVRGFLRSYATYLGLDADEMEEEWHKESGSSGLARPAFVGAPQPITLSRRIVFQRSHVVIALVAVIVILVGSYFGYQLTRYLSYPTLAVSSAGAQSVTLPVGTTTYVLTGTATAGTTVLISWNGQDPKIVIADDGGHWSYQAVLQPGQNQFDVTAKNLDTNHASDTTRLIVIVALPTPTPQLPSVALLTPPDGAFSADGNVTVTGTSTMVSTVTLTWVLVGGPLPSGATLPPATPTPAPTATPAPASPGASGSTTPSLSMKVAADGKFTFSVPLGPGRWQLIAVGTATQGGAQTQPATRTVSVPFTGIHVLIQVKGNDVQALHIAHDGKIDVGPNAFEPDGWSITVTGKTYVCVSASYRAAYVFLTVNGTDRGPVSSYGGTHAWIEATGAPRNVASC